MVEAFERRLVDIGEDTHNYMTSRHKDIVEDTHNYMTSRHKDIGEDTHNYMTSRHKGSSFCLSSQRANTRCPIRSARSESASQSVN